MEKILDNLIVLGGGILLYVADKLWKRWKEKNRKKEYALETISELNKLITHEEQKILWRYDAMRAYVIHFTNGTSTDAGIHLWKISFHNEVLQDYYVEPIAKHYKVEMVLPEMFQSPMNHVMTKGRYFIDDVEKYKQQAQIEFTSLNESKNPSAIDHQYRIEWYNWLLGYGVKCVLWLALYKQNRTPGAILVLHWPAPRAIHDSDIPKISDMKNSIEDIINNKKSV